MAEASEGITRGFGEWGHLQVAEESRGITRWLWSVGGGASTGGFGECVHHQEWGHLQVALESEGMTRWLWSVGGISRWLWRVGASPGGFGEWGHHQVALESEGIDC